MNQHKQLWARLLLMAANSSLLIALGGCSGHLPVASIVAGESSDGTSSRIEAAEFEDIPVPKDCEILYGDSLVFGQGSEWYGRLALRSTLDETELVDFFRTNLAQVGWQELSAVRSEASMFVFGRDNRILALEIASGGLGGSAVTITVAPIAAGGTLPLTG